MIEDIEKAIETTKKYNMMSFEQFIWFLEKELDIKFSEKLIKDWKFVGLNNIDFYKLNVL